MKKIKINYLKIFLFFLLIFELFILIASISYITHSWKDDYVITNNPKNIGGKFGHFFSNILINEGFGIGTLFLFPFIINLTSYLLFNKKFISSFFLFINGVFWCLWLSLLFGYFSENKKIYAGDWGVFLSEKIEKSFGIGLIIFLIFSLFFYLNLSWIYFKKIKNKKLLTNIPDIEIINIPESNKPLISKNIETNEITFEIENNTSKKINNIIEKPSINEKKIVEEYDHTLELKNFNTPKTDILIDYDTRNKKISEDELEENKNKILTTLKNYGIEIVKIKATIGPAVTLYEIIPTPGTKISKIRSLEDDIALNLSAIGIRIIAPIPGKGTIGIEIPNKNPNIVSLKSVINSNEFKNNKFEIPICLGKNISNENVVVDLCKMPHLLLAGATGQGKSVCLNVILTSILYSKHPSEAKLVLIDPKKVELSLFSLIEKYFLAKMPNEDEPIITDTKKVVQLLNSICLEMDSRYELLKAAKVRNIKEYNDKIKLRNLNPNEGHHFLPYIIVVIDEFADLIMTAGKEVETPLARIAQLARAIGIHLIIATQRPSVNIITGLIKANFPARIAFRVSSKVDSRTILDSGGADQLIGKGDMLFSNGGEIIRLQCPLIETKEVEKISEFIHNQPLSPQPYLLPEYELIDDIKSNKDININAQGKELIFEAGKILVNSGIGSTSLIQRRLKLGYNKAARTIEELEELGVVGPPNGSKPRDVLISNEKELYDIIFES